MFKVAVCMCLLLVVLAPAVSDVISFQARGAYFVPAEAVFKDIYGGSVSYTEGFSIIFS